jgi:hypothetical protein
MQSPESITRSSSAPLLLSCDAAGLQPTTKTTANTRSTLRASFFRKKNISHPPHQLIITKTACTPQYEPRCTGINIDRRNRPPCGRVFQEVIDTMSDWLEILTDSWVIIVGLAVIGLLGLGYYLWRRREAQRLPTDSNLAESIDKVTKWSPENEDE